MELKTYVCPNCGANTTNTQNCEYCGSLLVRFVEKGIDLSHTSYLNNNAVFPGLVEELKRNLELQSENPKDWVATDLLRKINDSMECISIVNGVSWDDSVSPEFDGNKKLCVVLDFSTYTDVSSYKDFNDKRDAKLAKFRQLDSFPLFSVHNETSEDQQGCLRYDRSYAINFGEDAEGAARLASEILIKVEGWSPTEPYDMFTNVGRGIERARNAWIGAHGFGDDSGSEEDGLGFSSPWTWVIAAVIFIIFLIYR